MQKFLDNTDAERVFFELAFSHAPIGMALVGPDRRFLRVNQAMCALMGRTQAELQALKADDVAHPEDINVGIDEFRRMLERQIDFYEVEKRYVQPGGKVVWTQLSVTAARRANGELAFLIGQAVDVSTRREAEIALSQFFSISINLMGLVGADGYLKRVNQAWTSVLGYEEAEILAVPYLNVIHPDDHGIVRDALERMDRERRVQDVRLRMRHKLGHYRMMSWNAVYPPEGDAFYAVSQDVTNLHHTMETLAETNLRLKETMSELDALRGIIPICSSCRRIRSDDRYWHSLETFISQHSGATFSHGLCPDCLKTARELMQEYVGRKPRSLSTYLSAEGPEMDETQMLPSPERPADPTGDSAKPGGMDSPSTRWRR